MLVGALVEGGRVSARLDLSLGVGRGWMGWFALSGEDERGTGNEIGVSELKLRLYLCPLYSPRRSFLEVEESLELDEAGDCGT